MTSIQADKVACEHVTTSQRKRKIPRLIIFPLFDTALRERVRDYYCTEVPSGRPPVITVDVLTMTVQLHMAGIEYPTRQQLAEHMNCSIWTIDSINAAAMQRGMLRQEVSHKPSPEMSYRPGVNKAWHYVPSSALLSAVTARANGHAAEGEP